MNKVFLAAVASLVGVAGLVLGQPPASPARPRPVLKFVADDGSVPYGPSADAAPAPPPPPAPAPAQPLPGVTFPGGPPATPSQPQPGGRPWTGPAIARDVPVLSADGTPCGVPPAGPTPGGCTTWAGTEALIWWEKKQPLPPDLVTSGSVNDLRPGALGQPGTYTLGPGLDPTGDGYGAFAGVRAFAGAWLDPHQGLGLEAGGFVLEDRGTFFALNSTAFGLPLLALRHFDPVGAPGNTPALPPPTVGGGTAHPAAAPASDAFLIAAPPSPIRPGSLPGGLVIRSDSQLWGADGHVLHALYWSPDFHLVALAGFRYLNLTESVGILTQRSGHGPSQVFFVGGRFPQTPTDGGNTPQLASEVTDDAFHVRNQFYGGQVGLRGEYWFDRFFVRAGCALDLGGTEETQTVQGNSTLQPRKLGTLVATRGGLFALPSNSGESRHGDFGVIPELQLQGGVLLTPWLRATIGYDFLYWSEVLRPGNQIDLTVDRRQVPTDPAFRPGSPAGFPRPQANPSDFWVQGLSLGLEVTY